MTTDATLTAEDLEWFRSLPPEQRAAIVQSDADDEILSRCMAGALRGELRPCLEVLLCTETGRRHGWRLPEGVTFDQMCRELGIDN